MTTAFQKTISQKTSEAFWSQLSPPQIPQETDVLAATTAARDTAFRTLTSDDHALEKEFPKLSAQARKSIHYDMLNLAPPLRLPTPAIYLQLAPWRLAFVALIGGFLGLFLLTPPMLYLLKMRDLGLFLGGPLGAFAFVWLSLRLTEDNFLRNTLGAALGVAVTTEIFLFLQQSNPLSQLWSRLSGQQQQSPFKRFLLYALGFFLLLLSKKEQRLDRERYAEQINAHIDIWVAALFKCIHLYNGETASEETSSPQQDIITGLGSLILQLHRSSADTLKTAAHEIIVESKNLGFEGLQGEPRFLSDQPDSLDPKTFVWADEHTESYETFGSIEAGDRVQEEKPPVVLQGTVTQKGLVRKVRRC